MVAWAQQAVFYHIVIDRFATGRCQFQVSQADDYARHLGESMGGTLHGLAASLDYLQDLGVDALILTPFFKGKKYHGYWVTDFFAVDPRFGDMTALRTLIDAAHRREIRIIMDLPVTHCHRDSSLARAAYDQGSPTADWLCRDPAGQVAGFFGDLNLPELNLDHDEVSRYVERVVDFWLGLGFDGIRFDHAKRPSAHFWRRLSNRLRVKYPQVMLLGENWGESGEVGALNAYLHGELNIPLAGALRQFARQPSARGIKNVFQRLGEQRSLRETGYALPAFVDNHDMERISCVADGKHPHITLTYFVMFTLPYPCILYYGSEAAQSQSENLPPHHYERDRYFREPMAWRSNDSMTAWIRRLIALRRQYRHWFTGEPHVVSLPLNGVFAYRYVHAGTALTILLNLKPATVTVPVCGHASELLIGMNQREFGGESKAPSVTLAGYDAGILVHSADEEPLQAHTTTPIDVARME